MSFDAKLRPVTVHSCKRTTTNDRMNRASPRSGVVQSEFLGTTDFLVRRSTRETVDLGFSFHPVLSQVSDPTTHLRRKWGRSRVPLF
jgi:hypothetical protein